jgi:hypothetical protein
MSAETEKMDFLKQEINARLAHVDGSRLFYRKMAYRLYMSAIMLGAVTTVLLGLNIEGFKEVIRITALIITASVTVINAYMAFFNHKDLWLAYNLAQNRFKTLLFEIEFTEKGGEPLQMSQVMAFEATYQSIIDELNSTWQKNRTPEKKTG